MKNSREKRKSLVLILFLTFASIATFQTSHVLADIPHNISIQPWTSGTHTILNITITMDTGAPTSSHYVDKVQVNISGVTHNMAFTSQPAPTFVVQYDMGEITDTPTVQARAECTVHGWSGWTSPQTVPEFSLVALLPMLAVLAVAVLFLHSKIRNPK